MGDLLAELEADVASLGKRSSYALSDSELTETLTRVTGSIGRLTGLQADLVREADGRGLPASLGYSSTAVWLREQLRMSHAAAKFLTRLGASLDHRPALRDAITRVAVTGEQAAAIARTLDTLGTRVDAEIVDKAEAVLIGQASRFHPGALATLGERILFHVAPQVAEDQLAMKLARDEQRAMATRSLTLIPEAGTSRTKLVGWLTTESAAILSAALDPLAKPAPSSDGVRDPRTAGQRRADALIEVRHLALRTEELPQSGGERPHLTVTMSYDVLADGLGKGLLDDGRTMSADVVRRLACDAKIIPAVLGGCGEILDLGRSSRTWTGAARRAIVLRDGGCAFPGCDRPPKWRDVHHIKFWSLLGRTDLDNGVLLCGFHHQLIHHTDWEVRMGADGLPEFIPPFEIDPLRRPRRNSYHRRQ